MYKLEELNKKKVSDLKEIAKSLNIPKAEKLLKSDLVYQILDYQSVLPTNKTADAKKESDQQKQRQFRQRKPKEKKKQGSFEKKEEKVVQTEKIHQEEKRNLQSKSENKKNYLP